jgi:hypothetical protein
MPIELDVTPEEQRITIIKNCGAKYLGELPPQNGTIKALVYFSDPLTKSTLMLPAEEVTPYNVRRKLHESRGRFGMAIIEASLLGNLELIEQLKKFILSLERTRNLPDQVVTAASHAAVMEITSFELANVESEINAA